MHFTTALLVLPLALAHAPGTPTHPRRHHVRAVIDANKRELAGAGFNDTATYATSATSAAITSTTAAASTASSVAETSDAATSTAASSTLASSTIISSAAESSITASSTSDAATSTSALTSLTSSSSSTLASSSTSTLESTSSVVAPTTLSDVASTTAVAATSSSGSTVHSTVVLVTTASRSTTSPHTSTATSAADSTSTKSSGLGKTALIAIIVVASVVGLAAAAFTAFRKWKLKPSNRFGSRMKPIDFSPHNDTMDDDFFEKTLQRTASNSSASRQRQELVAELDDPNHVAGIPQHDFTAGATNMAGAGVGAGGAYMYGQDAYAQGGHDQYQYDAGYAHGYDQNQHAYPPHPQGQYADYPAQDQPINGDGYADLQRGGSIGSGSGHGHTHGQAMSSDQHQQVYPGELTFPTADQYGLGRPTGGADGPYAQAAQYRGY